MGRLQKQWEALYREIRSDIFKFCQAMNFEPTWQQKLILQAVQDALHSPPSINPKRRIACKSGKGPGKTTASALGTLWHLIQDVDTLAIVTAPTQRQCKDVWLTEVRRRLSIAHPLLQKFIQCTRSRVIVGGRPDWGAKLVTATKKENFQGYHQSRMAFIVEEASGVSREIIEAIKEGLSNDNALFMQIGNPNTRDCDFFDCFNGQRDHYTTITLNAEETPRRILDPERNKAIEREFGRESDVYRISVLGEFPSQDPDCVMSSEDLEACTKTDMVDMAMLSNKKQFGLDLARFGGDENCVYRRSGNAIVAWKWWVKVDPSVALEWAFKEQLDCDWKNEACVYVPDANGIGQGVLHRFYEASKTVHEFMSNHKPSDPRKYENKVTEAYFEFAKLVKSRMCHIPNDNRLIKQLSTRRYYMNKKGQLTLESKDDYKDRGYESPDRADALVMAFYDRTTMAAQISERSAGRQAATIVRRS